MRKLFLLVVLMLVMVGVVGAVQPTQSFNKIFLNPFYLAGLTANTNYSYSVNVAPPDGVSSVSSAIVSFNAQINGQTQSVSIWVNGVACSTSNYTVATAYSTTGNVQIYFDCTNRITRAGVYNVTIRSTVNTGAFVGWVDLTYMNNPFGGLEVHGTEYVVGDRATAWLQLKDSQGLPVNNATCYLDIYAPLDVNSSHVEIVKLAPMLYLVGSEGVYYYDLVAPNVSGVYMMIGSCAYRMDGAYIYSVDGTEIYSPLRNATSGTYTGSPIFLNDFEDWIYEQCDSGGGKNCTAIYDFNTSIHFPQPLNATSLDLYYMGESSGNNVVYFSWYNWSGGSYVLLPNSLTMSATASSVPTGVGDFQSNVIPIQAYNSSNGLVRVRVSTSFGNTFKQYSNWLNVHVVSASGTVVDLKGSGEMHIRGSSEGLLASAVWNASSRTLTAVSQSFIGGTEYSTLETTGKVVARMTDNAGEPVTGANCSLTVFFNSSVVLNQSPMTEYVGTPSGVYYLDFTLSGVAGVYPYAVDCLKSGKNYYMVSSYHIFGNTPEAMAGAVWNASNRNLTYYEQVDLTNYSRIEASVNASTLNITGVLAGMDSKLDNVLSAFNSVASNVWNFVARYTHGEVWT